MKILVTGNKSGLGRYFFESFHAVGLDKDTSNEEKEKMQEEGVDVIIHCAFNSSNDVTSDELSQYRRDNILLTEDLAEIPHQKFIFISSVDVYEKDEKKHIEDEIISVNRVERLYGFTKLIAESIVKEYGNSWLIMRCSAFLGKGSRKNSLKKIIEDEQPVVTLTPDSEFNYVLYKDVLEFVKTAMEKDLQGIYNIASSENIRLSKVAEMFHKSVTFGGYKYAVGNIDNQKAISVVPAFQRTPQEIIKEFETTL